MWCSARFRFYSVSMFFVTFVLLCYYQELTYQKIIKSLTLVVPTTALENHEAHTLITPSYGKHKGGENEHHVIAESNQTFDVLADHRPEGGQTMHEFAKDTITALDNRTLIISPYYDPRSGPSVRVIAIIHVSVKELYCVFHCSLKQSVSVQAAIDIHRDSFGFPYGTADLLCKEPSECDYRYISIQSPNSSNAGQKHLFEVRNHPLPATSSNFTVCISTLYGGYNNALQMVQNIEMYKILGASRVIVYNTSCSQAVDKVLRYYNDEGTLEVVSWPIDNHLKTSRKWHYEKGLPTEIGYYGQTAALNDCLYRNMYRTKFLLLNDNDEILLPVQDHDWPSLMERLQNKYPNTSVFSIANHVFRTSVSSSDFDLWSHVPGVNILRHPFREPISEEELTKRRKMIVNPRNVIQTSIHNTLKHTGKTMEIPQNMTISFHCRVNLRKDITKEDLIHDDILRRYNVSLVPNVDRVIQRLFPQL